MNALDVFCTILLPGNSTPEFPLDFLAPGAENNLACAVLNGGQTDLIEKSEYVLVPLVLEHFPTEEQAWELLLAAASHDGQKKLRRPSKISKNGVTLEVDTFSDDANVIVQRNGHYGIAVLDAHKVRKVA